MKLLIAGWQGQLASALVALVPGRPDVSSFAVGRPALDLCELPTIQRAMSDADPDVIINTAAYTAVDQAETDAEAAFALNRDGARMLAEAAAVKRIPIIHVSTDYVFSGDLDRPWREDDPTEPTTVYGRSKLEGEQAVAAANPQHIILRTSWVYSAAGSNFVRSILEKAGKEQTIDVVADQVGSPTYAPHLANAIIDLAVRISIPSEDVSSDNRWGVYHAAGGGAASWFQFAEEVLARAAVHGGSTAELRPITTADYPTKAPRLANSQLDCSKLTEQFGLTLPDWRDGLDACFVRLAEDSMF